MIGIRRSAQLCPCDLFAPAEPATLGTSTGMPSRTMGLPTAQNRGANSSLTRRGTSGDLTEVWVRCECGKAERSMAQAAVLANHALGSCDGARPWLGAFTKETCGEPSRLLIRSASNAYFPQLMSVISLPDRDQAIKQTVDRIWNYLEAVEEIDQLRYERKKAAVKEALDGFSDEEVYAEIESRKLGGTKTEKSVKVAELETLIAAKDEIGEDRPDGVFYARNLPRKVWDQPWMAPIQRVVLVHRLREVVAQVGFTRFESAAPDTEGELDIGVKRAALAREISWLPAFENRGGRNLPAIQYRVHQDMDEPDQCQCPCHGTRTRL